jgi:hypothetical protein
VLQGLYFSAGIERRPFDFAQGDKVTIARLPFWDLRLVVTEMVAMARNESCYSIRNIYLVKFQQVCGFCEML